MQPLINEHMQSLSTLIAHDPHTLDPALDQSRDEGEARLALVRLALRVASGSAPELTKNDSQGICAFLTSGDPRAAAIIHTLLFDSAAQPARKPKVLLVSPITKILTGTQADMLDERQRLRCYAIKDTNSVVTFDWPPSQMPSPLVRVTFPLRDLGEKAKTDGIIEIKKSQTGLTIQCVSCVGARRIIKAELTTQQLEIIKKLFKLEKITTPSSHPVVKHIVPDRIALHVADFLQTHLRFHVAAAACAPPGATRPLVINKIRLEQPSSSAPHQIQLACEIHPSSVKCFCTMHRHDEKPNPLGVTIRIGICGRPRTVGGTRRQCARHLEATPANLLVTDVCTANTCLSITCSHKNKHDSQFIADIGLFAQNRMHATLLCATAAEVTSSIEPHLNKDENKISEICTECEEDMQLNINELDRLRASTAIGKLKMLQLDNLCVSMLDSKNIACYTRKTTKARILAREDGDKVEPLRLKETGPEITSTHIHLFRNAGVMRRS